MFFVSKEGNVTTLHQPQTLRALQLVDDSSGLSRQFDDFLPPSCSITKFEK